MKAWLRAAACIAIMTPCAAKAAPFHIVAVSSDSVSILDRGTLRRSGDTVTGWIISIPMKDINGAAYARMKLEWRCNSETARRTYTAPYRLDGTTTSVIDRPEQPWAPVIPESVGAAQLKAACGPAPPAAELVNWFDPAEMVHVFRERMTAEAAK